MGSFTVKDGQELGLRHGGHIELMFHKVPVVGGHDLQFLQV